MPHLTSKSSAGPAGAPQQPARPKTFRRPAGWEQLESASAVTKSSSGTQTPLTLISGSTHPSQPKSVARSASDRHYGLLLIAIIVAVNVLLAIALSHSNSPTTNAVRTVSDALQKRTPEKKSASEVTIFSTPEPMRRTAKYLTLDGAIDSTDILPNNYPAPPDASKL